MDTITPDNYAPSHALYFDAKLMAPLVIRIWKFRCEAQYEEDEFPERTAILLLGNVVACLKKKLLLLVPDQLEKKTDFQRKKGVLWKKENLLSLWRKSFEVFGKSDESRIVSIIEIPEFSSPILTEIIDGGFGREYVLGNCANDLDSVLNEAENWVDVDSKAFFAFNDQRICKSLLKLNSIGIVRYYCADNGRDETIALISQKDFIHMDEEQALETLSKSYFGFSS